MTEPSWQAVLRDRGRIAEPERYPAPRPATVEMLRARATKKYSVRLAVEKRLEAESADDLRAAHELLVGGDPPATPPPPDALALVYLLTQSADNATASRLLDRLYGLPIAIEAWARSAWKRLVPSPEGTAVQLRDGPRDLARETWFRSALLRADDATRRDASERIRPCFDDGNLEVRALIVERFAHELDWARALADQVVASPERSPYVTLAAMAIQGTPVDFDTVARVVRHTGPNTTDFETMLGRFGADALPLAYELASRARHASALDRAGRALSLVPTDESTAFFVTTFDKKSVRRHAISFFEANPERAGALSALARKRSRAARDAAALMEACRRATSEVAPAEAPLDALPEILVDAPWRRSGRAPRRPRRKTIEHGPLPGPSAYHGLRREPSFPGRRVMDEAETGAWRQAVSEARDGQGRPMSLFYGLSSNAIVPKAARLAEWNSGWPFVVPGQDLTKLLAENGTQAFEGLVRHLHRSMPKAVDTWRVGPCADVEDPRIAALIALGLDRPSLADFAYAWIRRFEEAAIAGLVPAAVGKRSRLQIAAVRGLRDLVKRGHQARIRARAEELGPDGADAIDAALAVDPRLDCPRRPPDLGEHVTVDTLPRPTLRDGRALPSSAVHHLLEMLAFTGRPHMYAGLDDVIEACDRRSLAELAWALARRWEAVGEPTKHAWMVDSLVHLADDEVVRRTTPALRSHRIVGVLRQIGTDAAAMELATIAYRGTLRRSPYHGAFGAAEAALDAIAMRRRTSRDDLDETLTPTLGLDSDGLLRLDLGGRRFVVSFDEHLVPLLRSDDGRPLRRLPPATGDGKLDGADTARRIFDDLREDVETIAFYRIEALERAMHDGRAWPASTFAERWIEHPLMLHLARRIVLHAEPGGTFRVAEDGSLANVDDDRIEVAGSTPVTIPHPGRWPDTTLPRWRELFADYELVQPFSQLHRSIPEPTDADLDAPRIEWTAPRQIQWTGPRRLNRAGYAGASSTLTQPRPDGSVVVVMLHRGGVGDDLHTKVQVARQGPSEGRGPRPHVSWRSDRERLVHLLDLLNATPPR